MSVRGGGPGTRETDALHPQNLIETIHAICLTGGSAFGLAAADGVVAWLEERGLGFPVGPDTARVGVVPVVPAAVIFDLGRGGRFEHRPDASFGSRAIAGARANQGRWGSVGAGAGARAGGLQGGIGTASVTVDIPTAGGTQSIVVGAVAVVNANGSVVDPTTGRLWESDRLGLRNPSQSDRRRLVAALDAQATSLNTTIGVVATSADLDKSEVTKLADVAHDGLARAIRPAHSMFDGDTVFGLATGAVELGRAPAALRAGGSRHHALNALLAAAAESFAMASAHAVLSAVRLGSQPTYGELCPSAFR